MPLSPSSAWATIVRTLTILAGCLTGPAMAATLLVGPGMPYKLPSAAAAVAHDGDHIKIGAGSYSDCAVWKANNLTIEGAGPDATMISGRPCAGKALFIAQGNAITIRNLALTNAHVADFNGAGIRAEGGDLTVEHVRFADDEDGILAGVLPGKKIVVRDSEFIGDGTCEGGGGCAHGIYVGHIGLLRVEHSRFLRTRSGHHIKSRSLRTEVIGCDMADGTDGTSSFAVDVPNGGAVVVRDNHIQKGPRSENHQAAIMVGEEGASQPTPEIIVEHNTFRVDGGYESYLLNNRTPTGAVLTGNTLQGNAQALLGNGHIK
ncbi:hypothetical protein [Acidisphaera sp. S103]|uniref:hypothetical protein n=1 Tax=Acidisphaera sp. S103 TaxID=1747223 RepID=UPI00131DB9D9|nr:hypothetical protein [Acidisphaera sp. S103]